MRIRDVLLQFHNIVPFPWTTEKIRKLHLDPTVLILDITEQLELCEDKHLPSYETILQNLKELTDELEHP